MLLRFATASFGVSAFGDIVFGITCLTIYGFLIHASIFQILLMPLFIVISTVAFLAAVITIYSASFLFTDSSSVTTGLFEMFFTPSLFHGGAFRGVMRFIFTFIIPSLLIGTLPVEVVKNFSFEKFLLVSILTTLWLVLSINMFNRGVRKYESTNFMTFGN